MLVYKLHLVMLTLTLYCATSEPLPIIVHHHSLFEDYRHFVSILQTSNLMLIWLSLNFGKCVLNTDEMVFQYVARRNIHPCLYWKF